MIDNVARNVVELSR